MPVRRFLLGSTLMLGLSGAVRVGLSEELEEPVEDIAPPGDLNISSFLEPGHDLELWPDQTVYWKWTADDDPWAKKLVEKAMHMWKSRTCIKFEEAVRACGVADTEPECFPVFLSVTKKPTRSNLGYHANVNRGMNFQKKGLNLGTVLRELGHIIGLRYELERSDYHKFVSEDLENVDEDMRALFRPNPDRKGATKGLPYDLGSIMHFGEFEYSNNPGIVGSETIRVKKADDFGNCRVGQHSELSIGDILTVNKLYGCSADTYCADSWNRCSANLCETDTGKARCQQTCGFCTCEDKSPGCEDLAKSGHCGEQQAEGCAKSCGLCAPSTLPCIDDADEFEDEEGEMLTCKDGLRQIVDNDHRLGCEFAWFQELCPLTCGSCTAKPYCF